MEVPPAAASPSGRDDTSASLAAPQPASVDRVLSDVTTVSPPTTPRGAALVAQWSAPTPPQTAQDPQAARRPTPLAALVQVDAPVATEAQAQATPHVLLAAAGPAASTAAEPTPDRPASPPPPPPLTKNTKTGPAARPRRASAQQQHPQHPPPLLRNPYGLGWPRPLDPAHVDSDVGSSGDGSASASSLPAQQQLQHRADAALYDASAARLRVVQEERRALLAKSDAARREVARLEAALCTVAATASGDAPVQASGSPRSLPEAERAVRQLRAMDAANDALRRRLEALQVERQHWLTLRNARLRRPVAASPSTPFAAPAAAAAGRSSRRTSVVAAPRDDALRQSAAMGVGRPSRTTLTSPSHALDDAGAVAASPDSRLAAAQAEQRGLRQAVALALSKERGRLTAVAELNARGFTAVTAPGAPPSKSGAALPG